MGRNFRIGDRVKLTKNVSIKHYKAADRPITGTIRKINPRYRLSTYLICPFGIEFDDRPNKLAYYAGDELKRIR